MKRLTVKVKKKLKSKGEINLSRPFFIVDHIYDSNRISKCVAELASYDSFQSILEKWFYSNFVLNYG